MCFPRRPSVQYLACFAILHFRANIHLLLSVIQDVQSSFTCSHSPAGEDPLPVV